MAGDLRTFAIVGAGQSGAWIARTLRSESFDGRIVLIGDEAHAPYSRPPLCKAILAGANDTPDLHLLPEAVQTANAIELWRGKSVSQIDRRARRLVCSDGTDLEYDRLFLTTGSRAMRPDWAISTPGGRVHVLRTLDDAYVLRAQLNPAAQLIVVGGGWIGLEVAASARQLAVAVIVIERADRLCARSVPPVVSHWLQKLHADRGVRIQFGVTPQICYTTNDTVALTLNDGQQLSADLCLVAVGNIPNVNLAKAAGLAVDNGVVVDEWGRTSDPHIYAAGDVTNLPCPVAQSRVRRESWANAQNQAIAVAKAALGSAEPYRDVPWLWSDQYGCDIQILGMPERGTRWMTRGRPEENSGSWLALSSKDKLVGVISVNSPRDLRTVRKAMLSGEAIDLAGWANV